MQNCSLLSFWNIPFFINYELHFFNLFHVFSYLFNFSVPFQSFLKKYSEESWGRERFMKNSHLNSWNPGRVFLVFTFRICLFVCLSVRLFLVNFWWAYERGLVIIDIANMLETAINIVVFTALHAGHYLVCFKWKKEKIDYFEII